MVIQTDIIPTGIRARLDGELRGHRRDRATQTSGRRSSRGIPSCGLGSRPGARSCATASASRCGTRSCRSRRLPRTSRRSGSTSTGRSSTRDRSRRQVGARHGRRARDRRGHRRGRRRGGRRRRAARHRPCGRRHRRPPRRPGPRSSSRATCGRSTEVERAVADAEQALGGLDGLVNNAGVNAYFDAVAMTEDDWDSVFAVDLKAAWMLAKAALPGADRAPRRDRQHQLDPGSTDASRLLSLRGREGRPRRASPARSRSSTRRRACASTRWRRGTPTRISCRSGSTCRTTRRRRSQGVLANIPLGRMADPREVGNAVVFLLSDRASAITGATLAVDCGIGARFAANDGSP